jgi:hypothetical protein
LLAKAGYDSTKTAKQHPAEHIRWREVESSNVEAVGWDSDMNLYARFKWGGVYRYDGVSRQRSVACSLAPSVGRYFHQKIKPNYKAVKIA